MLDDLPDAVAAAQEQTNSRVQLHQNHPTQISDPHTTYEYRDPHTAYESARTSSSTGVTPIGTKVDRTLDR